MDEAEEFTPALERFARSCRFDRGALVLDLDGTALLEREGKVFISSSVEEGVRAIHDLKRPVVLNTLRFPISVLNSVGEAWYKIADTPILTVLLNGSVAGYIVRQNGTLAYEELIAFPLQPLEIETLLAGISRFLADGIRDLLLFYYSRNWQEGESLWTPDADRVPKLKEKYLSAQHVFSGEIGPLRDALLSREICMACLFIDRPQDTLMAYQHTKRNNFITAPAVDKASGLRALAAKLNFSLEDSVGAGDTEMDSFLSEVGLAIVVGRAELPYRGRKETIRVENPQQLGDCLSQFTRLVAGKAHEA